MLNSNFCGTTATLKKFRQWLKVVNLSKENKLSWSSFRNDELPFVLGVDPPFTIAPTENERIFLIYTDDGKKFRVKLLGSESKFDLCRIKTIQEKEYYKVLNGRIELVQERKNFGGIEEIRYYENQGDLKSLEFKKASDVRVSIEAGDTRQWTELESEIISVLTGKTKLKALDIFKELQPELVGLKEIEITIADAEDGDTISAIKAEGSIINEIFDKDSNGSSYTVFKNGN